MILNKTTKISYKIRTFVIYLIICTVMCGSMPWMESSFFGPSYLNAQNKSESDEEKTLSNLITYNRLESKARLRTKVGWNETIDFVLSDLSMENYLTLFSTQYEVNILNLSNVKSKKPLSLSLKSMHPVDIFDTIINSWSCDWYYSHGVIKIVESYPLRVYNLNYVNVKDVQETITSAVGLQSVTVNDSSNSIIAKGPVESLDQLEFLISGIDVPPKQVLIAVKIVEITKTLSDSMGLDVNTNLSGTGSGVQTKGFSVSPDTANVSGLFFKGMGGEFLMNFDASLSDANSEVLASPKVLVTNHQKASIVTGQRLGYSTVTQTQTASIQTIKFLESGIKLDITPHITNDGEILMEIFPEISEGRIENGLPRESTIKTETQVMVKDGQTLVIGGLIQNKNTESVKGVPVLSDIPVLDLIFQKSADQDEKREIVVLITPQLIDIENAEDVILPLSVQNILKKVSETDEEEK